MREKHVQKTFLEKNGRDEKKCLTAGPDSGKYVPATGM